MTTCPPKRPIDLSDFFSRYADWDETRLTLCLHIQAEADLIPEETFTVIDELEELGVILPVGANLPGHPGNISLATPQGAC